MKTFSLTLPDNKTITGLSSLPVSTTASYKPLLVLLHGGNYAADYYDADAERSIEPLSTALGIPVVALNRQGYRDSSPIGALSDGQTNLGEQAKALNASILPALWHKFGKEAGASSIVLAGNSVGGMLAIMAAALHANLSEKPYPLAGICTTGVSDAWSAFFQSNDPPAPPLDETGQFVIWPHEVRDALMLMIPNGLSDASFAARHAELRTPVPLAEVAESTAKDAEYKKVAKDVQVPVTVIVGEHDGLWDTSEKGLGDFARLFEKARVEYGVVKNAPHCVELSHQGKGVLLQILGHALQYAVGYGIEQEKGESGGS